MSSKRKRGQPQPLPEAPPESQPEAITEDESPAQKRRRLDRERKRAAKERETPEEKGERQRKDRERKKRETKEKREEKKTRDRRRVQMVRDTLQRQRGQTNAIHRGFGWLKQILPKLTKAMRYNSTFTSLTAHRPSSREHQSSSTRRPFSLGSTATAVERTAGRTS